MTMPSTIAAAKQLCCCDEDSPCDCDCEAGVCHGCCWGVGDLVDYEHDWTGTFSNSGTGFFGQFLGTRNKCFERAYTGSSVRVQYVFFGCLEGCEGYPERFIYLFAPNLSPTGGGYDEIDLKECDDIGSVENWEQCSAGPCVRKPYSTSSCNGLAPSDTGIQYCLPEILGMVCESEVSVGDWEWIRIRIDPETGECSHIGLILCVDQCETCCSTKITDVDQLACNDPNDPFTNYETTDCAACTGVTQEVRGPTSLGCKHCGGSVAECGGFRGYCVWRMASQTCIQSGELYGHFNTGPGAPPQPECGCGCEADSTFGSSVVPYQSETCEVKSCQTLVIEPTFVNATKCTWHADEDLEDGGCCKKRKTSIGGAEVVQPGGGECPTNIDDWSFDPCGILGPSCINGCDCEDNPVAWAGLNCACPDCSGGTNPGWTGGTFDEPPVKTVCRFTIEDCNP